MAASSAIAARLGPPPPAAAPDPPARPRPSPPALRYLVLLTGATGAIAPASLDVVAALRRDRPEWSVEGILVGPVPDEPERRRIQGAGADRLWLAHVPEGLPIPESAEAAVRAVASSGSSPVGIAVVSDLFGRIVAGRLSARAGWGLTGDATGLAVDDAGRPRYRKPAFGGRWIAEIGTRAGPAAVTTRPGAFPRWSPVEGEALGLDPIDALAASAPLEIRAGGTELDRSWRDPLGASVLMVLGQGVGGPEGVLRLRRWATALDAAVGATRRVVDLGWVPRQLQVGLTGLSVEPRLALLVGVGGSMNHLVGLRRAGVLVAINRDPAAPIFREVDIGILGDWEEILPLLVEELGPILRPGRPAST